MAGLYSTKERRSISKLDAWPVAANPRLSPRELDQIVAHSGARRILLAAVVSKEAANHGKRLGAECRAIGPFADIAVGALNETAQPEPAPTRRPISARSSRCAGTGRMS
jgi:hypothetical protein